MINFTISLPGILAHDMKNGNDSGKVKAQNKKTQIS